MKESLGKTFLKLTHGEKVNFKTGEKSIIHSSGRRHKPITLFTGISSTIKVEHQSQRPVIQMKQLFQEIEMLTDIMSPFMNQKLSIDLGKETIFFSHYGESFLGKEISIFRSLGKVPFIFSDQEGRK